MVERCVRDAEVAGSNPVASTIELEGVSKILPLTLLPKNRETTGFEQAVPRNKRKRIPQVKTVPWTVFKPPRR